MLATSSPDAVAIGRGQMTAPAAVGLESSRASAGSSPRYKTSGSISAPLGQQIVPARGSTDTSAESRGVVPQRCEDRTPQILLQIDVSGRPVGKLEVDHETRGRADGANPHQTCHGSVDLLSFLFQWIDRLQRDSKPSKVPVRFESSWCRVAHSTTKARTRRGTPPRRI